MVFFDGDGPRDTGDLDDLPVHVYAARVAGAGFEEAAAHGDGNEAEQACAGAQADDPVVEGFVHHFELELDDPGVVAVEDGEGFGADEPADGRKWVLHVVCEGGEAVDEWVGEHEVG